MAVTFKTFKTLDKLCTNLGCRIGEKSSQVSEVVTPAIEKVAPSFKIYPPKSTVERAAEKMTGATQVGSNNRSFIIGNKRVITKFSPLSSSTNPRLTSDMTSLEPTQNIEMFCNEFKRRTGLDLHIPDSWNLRNMNNITDCIEIAIESGKLPADIKHIVMGHGEGYATNGSWIFEFNKKNVFDWINTNIPKGEKCFVAVCEGGNIPLNKARPGIGQKVTNSFTNPNEPAKIVKSGDNSIIGHYLSGEGVTYYPN